jgi:glycopeptide antibiotics resistance protein
MYGNKTGCFTTLAFNTAALYPLAVLRKLAFSRFFLANRINIADVIPVAIELTVYGTWTH